MSTKWYIKNYRRNLIDMHIADWDDEFLSQFDAKKYVEMVKSSNVNTIQIYAGSCLGICYWPTEVGHMHNGLKGRDILKETIDEAKENNLAVIVYYNIWSRWAYDNYPDWRMLDWRGKGIEVDKGGRFGLCCINSPFKSYAKVQIEELYNNYDFEGMWIDMLGWFGNICYCSHCSKRYLEETGMDLPYTVDWHDKDWVQFQRKREEWLAEFAEMIRKTAKKINPQISLVFNAAGWTSGWSNGASYEFFKQSDYVAGDFREGTAIQSLISKFSNAVTENKPIEYMTVRCSSLIEHTTTKPRQLIEAHVYSSIANNASFTFIDAIDPIGTINPEVYKMMGDIFEQSMNYEKYLDSNAKECRDIAIYMDFANFINFDENGKHVKDISVSIKPIQNAYNIAETLIDSNIPYSVITKKNLDELDSLQVLILSDVIMLDKEEIEAFYDFVKNGGSIYASGRTSLLTKEGVKTNICDSPMDFQLSELFGVSFDGQTEEDITYMRPEKDGTELFRGFSQKYPIAISDYQTKIKIREDVNNTANILARVTLPYTNPKDNNKFASAISNPPGIDTDIPALVLNKYGKGRVIYSTGKIEEMKHEAHRIVFVNILKSLLSRDLMFESNAYKPVEITMLNQEEKKRYIVNVLNYQKDLPNIPAAGIKIRINMGGKKPLGLYLLPQEEAVGFNHYDNWVEFDLPVLETFMMFSLEYEC